MPASRQPHEPDAMASRLYVETNTTTRRIPAGGSGNVPYSYLQLLGRLSLNPEPMSTSSQNETQTHTYEAVVDLLLQQPSEIRAMILNNLEAVDLLSLRATSRTLHNLIHDSSRGLCLGLCEHIAKTHGLYHIPINLPDLSAFFRMSHRYNSACEVATIIAERVARHVSMMGIRGDKSALDTWRKKKRLRLERRMKRSLIILQVYLMFMQNNMNDNEGNLEPLNDDEYTSLHNIFLFDDQEFLREHMSGLTEEDLMEVTAALDVLKLICRGRCVPFRMKSPAHPFTSVRQILILKGLAPFTELLNKDASLAQQEAILRRLSRNNGLYRRSYAGPDTDPPCPSLHILDGYWQSRKVMFDLKRSNKARDRFIDNQDIWDKSARGLMMLKLGKAPRMLSAASWIQKLCIEDEKGVRGSEILLGNWDQPDTS